MFYKMLIIIIYNAFFITIIFDSRANNITDKSVSAV